jgi:hypothetical protein
MTRGAVEILVETLLRRALARACGETRKVERRGVEVAAELRSGAGLVDLKRAWRIWAPGDWNRNDFVVALLWRKRKRGIDGRGDEGRSLTPRPMAALLWKVVKDKVGCGV